MSDLRPWTCAALLGSLWGAAEVSLGAVLSAARVPFAGVIMGTVGVLCLLTARRLFPAPGTSLAMGVVVAFLKVFSAGGLVVGPVVGILAQATAVELTMTASRSTAVGAVVGGALALALAPLQRAITLTLVAGLEGTAALDSALRALASSLGWRGGSLLHMLAGLVGTAAILGAIVGALSWRVAGRVRQRLRGP